MIKNHFVSSLCDTLNPIYRQKLSIKLKSELMIYDKDEKFFIVRFNNNSKIIGISRIVFNLNKHYLQTGIDCLKNNIKLDKNNVFLTGIWVSKKHRNKGLSKSLLNCRLKEVNEGDYLFSDVRKESPLIEYYKKIGLKIIGENKTHIYLYGEYNGDLIEEN